MRDAGSGGGGRARPGGARSRPTSTACAWTAGAGAGWRGQRAGGALQDFESDRWGIPEPYDLCCHTRNRPQTAGAPGPRAAPQEPVHGCLNNFVPEECAPL